MSTFTSYAAQRTLDGSRNALFSRPLRSPSLAGLQGDDYLLALRSSEPYMAMLRQQWVEDQKAALPLDLKAHYADKETITFR